MAIPSTLVESPEWDPGFYFMYTAILPTYLFGIIFNAMVIGAMLSNQKALISQRIDRIIFLLLAVHCIYSLFASVCQFLLRLWVASAAYSSFIGWTSSISILTLFVVNLALALERRVTIMSPTDPSIGRHASKIYTVLAILLLAFSCIMSWVYASSPSRNGLSPAFELQRFIWFGTMAAVMFPVILLTCWLYYTTYSHVAVLLAKSTLSQVEEKQRKVLISCIIMSSALVFLYTPELVFQTANLFLVLDDYHFHIWSRIALFAASLDVIVGPGLVLYFRRDIRHRLFEVFTGSSRTKREEHQMSSVRSSPRDLRVQQDGASFAVSSQP